jgi:hypothetical protein
MKAQQKHTISKGHFARGGQELLGVEQHDLVTKSSKLIYMANYCGSLLE